MRISLIFPSLFSKGSDILSGSQMELRDLWNEKFDQPHGSGEGKRDNAFRKSYIFPHPPRGAGFNVSFLI